MEEIQRDKENVLSQLKYEEAHKPNPKTLKLDMIEMINAKANI